MGFRRDVQACGACGVRWVGGVSSVWRWARSTVCIEGIEVEFYSEALCVHTFDVDSAKLNTFASYKKGISKNSNGRLPRLPYFASSHLLPSFPLLHFFFSTTHTSLSIHQFPPKPCYLPPFLPFPDSLPRPVTPVSPLSPLSCRPTCDSFPLLFPTYF